MTYWKPLALEKLRWFIIRKIGGIVTTPQDNYPYKLNKYNHNLNWRKK